METTILIAIGIFVGLIIVSQAFSPPTRETIVIVPVEPGEPSPGGVGWLLASVIGVAILIVLSSS